MIEKLYDALQPKNYDLKLDINPQKTAFSGTLTLIADLKKMSDSLTLHAKDLKIASAKINGVAVSSFEYKDDDALVLRTNDQLKTGEVCIEVTFSADITDEMHGMYPCYFEHEGKKKKLIATQFESHHAREVFPCIDEPAAKATFDLTLVTNESEPVLANMPALSHQVADGRLTTIFETTPKMSTYLLAFVTGEMNMKEATTKNGVIVRSWASKAQDPSWLDYSVKETVDLIDFYDDYFGIPYPLPKCDQVALPDFESGAMENWGLITYRETVFLSDPKNISLSTQQLVSLVIAHELSHQWFGNLVTMAWWDDLWLNESFANMTEYLSVDRLHPEWQIWEEFVAQDALSATNRDVYSDVQAVRVAVNNPSEIHTLFDPSIVYAKGGKLLKMLHDLLGDEIWRAGLKDYFEKNAYQNTTRDDLWRAFSDHTPLNIGNLMNKWIERSGQPLVTVEQDDSNVSIQQSRLLLDGGNDSTTWQIPLLADDLPVSLEHASQTFHLDSNNWVRLNTSGVGHYVVNYRNPDHKAALAAELVNPTAESTWKIARLNELIMLAKHGDTNLSEALEAISKTSTEDRAMVWSLISGVLGSAKQIVEGDETAETAVKQLTYALVKEHVKQLGWDYPASEPSNQTHLRSIILSLALSSEQPAIVDEALRIYRASDDPEALPAELRGLLLCAAVRFGTKAEFEDLIERYKKTSSAEYRSDITSALTFTKDASRAKQLTEMMLDTDIVRTQDTIRWFAYLMRNRYTKLIAWHWLTTNWSWIMEKFGGSKSYDDFARYAASFTNTNELYEAYKAFFADKANDPALKRTISIGLEEIKARVAWRARDQKPVSEWLNRYSL